MPKITYIGKSYETPNQDSTHPSFKRGQMREVTVAWMDKYHNRFGDDYIITEYENTPPTEGITLDGTPTAEWSRSDIAGWLATYDIKPKGYATKTSLLGLVATVMSPDGVEETEALVEESKTGDEE